MNSSSARARIRQTVIDMMTETEIRDFVSAVHGEISEGATYIDEDTFETMMEQVLSRRDAA